MRARVTAEIPAEVTELAEGLLAALNTTKRGTPRQRRRLALDDVVAWLLGEVVLDEDARVLLAAARRAHRLRRRADELRLEIRPDDWRST